MRRLHQLKSALPFRKNQSGFSLMEIMIAMMLLGVTGVSTLRVYSNSATLVYPPENAAYYLASQTLANMNEAVRQDWWLAGGRPLSTAGPAPQPAAENISGRVYTPAYTVNTMEGNADGDEDYRRVRVVVTWP